MISTLAIKQMIDELMNTNMLKTAARHRRDEQNNILIGRSTEGYIIPTKLIIEQSIIIHHTD